MIISLQRSLKKNYTKFFIIGTYLSSSNNNQTSLEEYHSELDIIKGIINSFEDKGEIIIVGNFQSFPQKKYMTPLVDPVVNVITFPSI